MYLIVRCRACAHVEVQGASHIRLSSHDHDAHCSSMRDYAWHRGGLLYRCDACRQRRAEYDVVDVLPPAVAAAYAAKAAVYRAHERAYAADVARWSAEEAAR